MDTPLTVPGDAAVRAHALLLAWYREMGVDAAVEAEPVDWLLRADVRPGAAFIAPAAPQPSAPPAHAKPTSGLRSNAPSQPAVHPPWEDGSAPVRTAPVLTSPVLTAAPATQRAPLRPTLVPTAAVPAAARQFPTSTPDDATLAAQAAAQAASSLEDLAVKLAAFDGCALKATAKSLCFYRGAATARLMVVGEAPRAEDDKSGRPFSGQLGDMLDKMLKAIGIDATAAHITNVVYWRPPGNRQPTAQEIAVCRPFFERQIAFVKPECLLLLGGPVTTHFFDRPDGIMKLRGKWRDVDIGGYKTRALVTLHPENLLKTPLTKRMAWRDLLAVDAALNPAGAV
jgi:uracil-DNA glycosylase